MYIVDKYKIYLYRWKSEYFGRYFFLFCNEFV